VGVDQCILWLSFAPQKWRTVYLLFFDSRNMSTALIENDTSQVGDAFFTCIHTYIHKYILDHMQPVWLYFHMFLYSLTCTYVLHTYITYSSAFLLKFLIKVKFLINYRLSMHLHRYIRMCLYIPMYCSGLFLRLFSL
jgi:hypothetical protein